MFVGKLVIFVDLLVIDLFVEVIGKCLYKFWLIVVKFNDFGLIFDIGKYLFGSGWCNICF